MRERREEKGAEEQERERRSGWGVLVDYVKNEQSWLKERSGSWESKV